MNFESFGVQVVFWLFLGVFVISAFFIPRYYMKKKKQHDERFVQNDRAGRAFGWAGSLVVIFICWFISLAVLRDLQAFWLISAIYVGHMIFYSIGTAIANARN